MMGNPEYQDDAPIMCFNPAKMWQFGWYSGNQVLLTKGQAWWGDLYGVADEYNNAVPIGGTMFIKYDGGSSANDYYIGWNHKVGVNSGVVEAGDQVTVVTRAKTSPADGYAQSWLVGKLSAGGVFQDPLIHVEVILINGLYARISINGGTQPTVPPTASPTQPPQPPSPPSPSPTHKPTSPPTQPPPPPPTQKPSPPPTQPPTHQPTQKPKTQPPTPSPTQKPTRQPTQPPTSPPTQKPTLPPTQPPPPPPTRKPTLPPAQPPTSPPATQKPTVPPTQSPPSQCMMKLETCRKTTDCTRSCPNYECLRVGQKFTCVAVDPPNPPPPPTQQPTTPSTTPPAQCKMHRHQCNKPKDCTRFCPGYACVWVPGYTKKQCLPSS